jgi:hypothetical protein
MVNDDPYPDDVCPGCQNDIEGWRRWPYHYPPGPHDARIAQARLWPSHGTTAPMPFTENASRGTGGPSICEWDRDMLTARSFRRRLIREGVTAE